MSSSIHATLRGQTLSELRWSTSSPNVLYATMSRK